MLKKVVILIVLVMSLAASVCMAEYNRYHWIYSDDYKSFAIDTRTFITGNNYDYYEYDVWIKVTYNEAGVQQVIINREKHDLRTDNYENLAFTLYHYQIKLYPHQLKTLKIVEYANDNSILSSYDAPFYESFEDTIPDTIGEMIVDEAFKYNMSLMRKP